MKFDMLKLLKHTYIYASTTETSSRLIVVVGGSIIFSSFSLMRSICFLRMVQAIRRSQPSIKSSPKKR